ncbi:MAG: efflux RND transporter periplasmic adaptor subunit [Opitutaceae bacterium]|nr:efflux RND transporter periplasmic adaptor subunit [Opitutaceae bacterium]
MAKSKSYGGLIVLLVLLLGGGGGAWYYLKGRTVKAPEFQITKVARGDITQSVTATGDLQPVMTVDIGAQVSGQIKEVLVDYNSKVKAGDVLARIDESTLTQRLKQAEADLESTKASNRLLVLNVERTKELFGKNLVSQQELDNIEAQLAQSNATLLTRTAAVENARLDLSRCTITAPIDGMVLDRKTDKGRTVNASMNAPVLFTLVNDLTKMQINAAVAEADIGSIAEGQEVKFTVDAFPSRTFTGTVRMVRNAASVAQSVVSYATIIDVSNDDLRLKPGMTANVSIIVQQRPNVLRIANGALRVRVPQELLASAPGDTKGDAGKAAPAAGGMTDDERMTATMAIMREIGFERGSTPSSEQIEKAKKLAKDKGLDPDLIAARLATPGGRGKSGGGGDRGSRGGGGGGSRGPSGPGGDRGFNNTIVTRTLYKFADPDAADKDKRIVPVTVKLGVSDGFSTEVLEGLAEGDTVLTGVLMPGAVAAAAQPPGGSNPLSGRSSFGSSPGRGPR